MKVLPPPTSEDRVTRAVRWAAAVVTETWTWLTGWSNYALARVLWIGSIPFSAAANYPFSSWDGFWCALWFTIVGVIVVASYRNQERARQSLAKGFRPKLWASWVEMLFLGVTIVFSIPPDELDIMLARAGSAMFFFAFFVADHHTDGGKSVFARAHASVNAMLGKIRMPALGPAVQPQAVRS